MAKPSITPPAAGIPTRLAILLAALFVAATFSVAPAEAQAAGALVAVMGDTGTGTAAQRNVQDAVAAGAQGMIGLGDYAYDGDAVRWREVFAPLTSRGSWLTLGNHDTLSDYAGLVPDGRADWSQSVGGARVVAVADGASMVAGSAAYERTRTELCGAAEPTRVLALHRAWWLLAGARHPQSEFPGDPAAMDRLVAECGVDLVLAAHEHNYQRLERGGIHYVIVGTGGRSFYPIAGTPPQTVAAWGGAGHLLLELRPDGYSARFRGQSGGYEDTFTQTPTIPAWNGRAETWPVRTTGGITTRSALEGGQGWNLWSNGYVERRIDAAFADAEVVVRAQGDPAAGVSPVLVVSLGGIEAGRSSIGSAVTERIFRLGAVTPGETVRVSYVNDLRTSTEDRNLVLDTVTVRPSAPPPEGLTFDSLGGNEWWVEVRLGGPDAPRARSVQAMDTNGPWVSLTLRSWGAWAGSFRIEPGHQVTFRATLDDGRVVTSCAFTHPGGQDSCDGTPGFSVAFRNVRGNTWWVETEAAATGGTIAGVEARVNSGSWTALSRTTWESWAKSMPAPSGSTVVFRARSTDGEFATSGAYRWPPS